ncbi:hypothetical protein SPRG_07962 [Saprolegnia parasitica CBS 223.65]|uniref:Transmembrane protein n=1 Tax=Saprolegnia parasitica (strain CBS 223.65) TaxID=695850 RepID=A0A067C709_SAPPC|nr:hypothetical protein SPRG_07962 [Saprolegnia parasitica CBS 223.65]KDO26559.1 hypothetical protein SPRG_07962 [Saprolegnia parasitica CBS 223.65]|eukprot:XP_012202701.1 hypothetical protein SPRG_07962 [Saprolegnia parasitica CBS 223.65]
MEATLRRAVNEFFFRDTWSPATYVTFAVVLVSTFFVSSGLSRLLFNLVDAKLQRDEANRAAIHTMPDASSSESDETSDSGSSDSSQDDSDDEEDDDDEPSVFSPVKIAVPPLIEIDATVFDVRDVEHLKTL